MTLTIPQLCASVSGRASPLGVALHDAGYRAANLPFKYVAIGSDDLRGTVEALKALNVRGFGVSMPHKAAMIKLLNKVSPEVRTIGACNTVVNEDGRLHGYNTDWRGAMDALRLAGVKGPGRAVLFGAGGVARAIAYGLKEAGWEVHVCARNSRAAKDLTNSLRLAEPFAFARPPYPNIQLVINATPVATYPGVFDFDWFPGLEAMFDVVFSPVNTDLVAAAKSRGLIAVPGWSMLLYQAVYQFELYTGQKAPVDAMRDALLANLA